MFFKKNEINPYPVSDTVRFRNLDKTITLTVRSGATKLVLGIRKAQEQFAKVNDENESEVREAAVQFAETIFGKEQAEQLMQFYENDYMAVITACSLYFSNRLGKMITKAQKK